MASNGTAEDHDEDCHTHESEQAEYLIAVDAEIGSAYWEDTHPDPLDFDEDVYALAISDLSQDFERCGMDSRHCGVLVSRVTADLLLIIGCIMVQVFLLREVKKFVTAKDVHNIRVAYGKYELAMYGNDLSHCDITANGYCRGRPKFFNAALFDTLDSDVQSGACHIPLSQPYFAFIVLWLWTTTCLGQFARLSRHFTSLIVRTEVTADASCIHERTHHEPHTPEGTQVIYSMTWPMKAAFTLIVFMPRGCIICYLLWLGCRWLLATSRFSDLVLNAVALEFIIHLGGVIYVTMVPERNKEDLMKTKMLPISRYHSVGYHQCVYLVLFNIVSCGWVYMYMVHFQQVLPDYRWDVHDVCKLWIRHRFAV